MEIRVLLSSCGLLGAFFLSLLPSLALSNPTPEAFFPFSRHHLRASSSETIQQYLIPHNRVRAKLGVPSLKWSKKLANFAARWAHQRRVDCALIHSHGDYGENLFWGSGKDWTPSDAVEAWAAEKVYYNHKTNSCTRNKNCLHYTQMVWRQSLRIGCARVTCRNGDTFIICNYDPHGNVVGEKPF